MPDQSSIRQARVLPWATLALLAATVLLLTLALAPIKQFYLAWIGLVPWLLVVRQARSARAAFLWSWLAGTIFFAANMWWMGFVSIPGTLALVLYLGIYWGLAALIIRGAGLLGSPVIPAIPHETGAAAETADPAISGGRPPNALLAILLIPAIWVGLEWLRGTLLTGLPWLYLGHTQTPMLPMCQIADITGAYGVSYWVAMVNVLVLAGLMGHGAFLRLRVASAVAGLLLVGTLLYGVFRILQSDHVTRAGPKVCVIQSDFPQSNSGNKGAGPDEILALHVHETLKAVAVTGPVDLVVWSETTLPPINPASRMFLQAHDEGAIVNRAYATVTSLARHDDVNILTGGVWAKWKLGHNNYPVAAEMRNSTYLFTSGGHLADERYDKVHLVPFGEYTPFRDTCPPLYHFFLLFNPYPDPASYELTPGTRSAPTVFSLAAPRYLAGHAAPATQGAIPPSPDNLAGSSPPVYRFVTPICFEDIDAPLVAAMLRPDKTGPRAGMKRADFLVNVTNDGWFRANEMAQHLQAATFRSIENRVPTARSVNTGISGFIDSVGNNTDLVPAGEIGYSTHSLVIDSRITFYTRFGDVFAFACAGIMGALALAGLYRRYQRRKLPRKAAPLNLQAAKS